MAPVQFGNYQIIRKIGAGGMAQVFEAQRVGLEGFSRRVALKCILPEMTRDTRFVEMFVNEARLGSQLHHPNIVEIQDFNKVNDIYYIAMEFVEGIDLGEVITRFRDAEREFPPGLVIDIMLQTLDGLGYAHEAKTDDGTDMNLVHRDIKPSNLLLTRRGTVKIADFGIAKAAINAYQTRTAEVTKGSLAYMAPEQITRESGVSPVSDLFSLGAVLFEMLSLRALFDGENMPSIMFKVAQVEIERDLTELEQFFPQFLPILRRSLARKVEDRYPNARAMADDLRLLKSQFPPGPEIQSIVKEFLHTHVPDDEEETLGEQTASLLGLTSNPLNQFSTMVNLAPVHPGAQYQSGNVGMNVLPNASNPSWNSTAFQGQQSTNPGVGQTVHLNPERPNLSSPSIALPPPAPARNWMAYVLGGVSAVILLVALSFLFLGKGRNVAAIANVTSNPVGAEILIDGELRSTTINGTVTTLVTPARVTLSDEGVATISLRKEGYLPYKTRVTYKVGEQIDLAPKLEPEAQLGALEISSVPPGAHIELNGKLISDKTPTLLSNLPAGTRYSVRLSLEGFVSAGGEVEVVRNGRAAFAATLLPVPQVAPAVPVAAAVPRPTPAPAARPEKPTPPPKGTEPAEPAKTPVPAGPPGILVVNAVPPDVVVFVDGARKGNAPVQVKLPAGNHRVRLERFDGTTEKEFSVTLTSGGETTRVWDMDGKQFISE